MLIFILFTIQQYYNKKYHFNYLNGNMQSLVRRYAQLGFKPGGRWILSVDGFSSLRQLPICFLVFFFYCFLVFKDVSLCLSLPSARARGQARTCSFGRK